MITADKVVAGKLIKREWDFEIGDTVDVHVRIKEGDKTRVQIFSGTIIRTKGAGIRQTFTVRRIVQGEGVERIFPVHSPTIVDVKTKKKGRVRRAKLYYLRDRVGKGTKIRERNVGSRDSKKAAKKEQAVQAPAAEEPK